MLANMLPLIFDHLKIDGEKLKADLNAAFAMVRTFDARLARIEAALEIMDPETIEHGRGNEPAAIGGSTGARGSGRGRRNGSAADRN